MPVQPGWSDAEQAETLVDRAPELIRRAWGSRLGPHEPATARQVQFQLRPGAGVSVVYSLRRGAAERFVGLTTEVLAGGANPGLHRLEVPDRTGTHDRRPLQVATWWHPHDPRLPGLPHAAVAASAERLWGGGDRLTRLQTITYRPLRRAVFRADFSTPGPVVATRSVFLKAMRPDPAEALELRHRLLAAAGLPVAPVLGPVLHGVVATAALPGEPLSTALRNDGGAHLDPAALTGLLDRLPEAVVELPRRPSWSERLARYADAAASALPEESRAVAALTDRVRGLIDARDPGPVVPVHGDFYEANILMSAEPGGAAGGAAGAGTVGGLLDLDSVGPGHRVDDLACLLGHLAVLPAISPRYEGIWSTIDAWAAVFSRSVDERALHARAAAVAVSLVAGARRPGARSWTGAARARLEAARRLAERAG
ncbi:phosphotransferase [Arthrobacter sp. JSM 101049]|uniref:phosphotransferase n=1 Tax=Arthrobacter sp. JSM 101049 TaxID=929097 RepID=UPI003567C47B